MTKVNTNKQCLPLRGVGLSKSLQGHLKSEVHIKLAPGTKPISMPLYYHSMKLLDSFYLDCFRDHTLPTNSTI